MDKTSHLLFHRLDSKVLNIPDHDHTSQVMFMHPKTTQPDFDAETTWIRGYKYEETLQKKLKE